MIMAVYIEPAQFPRDAEAIQALFSGYSASLGIDLTFQSFKDELASLPGKYEESQGGFLLIARALTGHAGHKSPSQSGPISLPTAHISPAVGCVALRRNRDNWCEMKRLYVVEDARGLKLGDKLVDAIVAQAKAFGYRGIRLDTLPNMIAAQRLYRRYGFVQIEPYYDTPIEGTIFMGCEFTSP
jgi:Acetyltransferases